MKLGKCYLLFVTTTFVLLTAGCSKKEVNGNPEPVNPQPPVAQKIPIELSVGVNSPSRVMNNAFEANDKIGLYVVNYNGSVAGTLAASGNQATNVAFTYSGAQWTSTEKVYWKDDATHADFYVYYPYRSSVADVSSLTGNIAADQSTEANFKSSILLWGKTANQTPTTKTVSVLTQYPLSEALLTLVPGKGYTAEQLSATTASVVLRGLKTGYTLNLTNGQIEATGSATDVKPFLKTAVYHALIVPQTLTEEVFSVQVTVDGKVATMKKAMTFVAGKQYNMPITINRTSDGINVTIGAWENDGKDYGGVAE